MLGGFLRSPVIQPQTTHGLVTLVGNQPLDRLWTRKGYWTNHERVRELSSTEVDRLLEQLEKYRLVEAREGAELRWYPRGSYGFWHHHAKVQLRCVASEWFDAEINDRVIVLQEL